MPQKVFGRPYLLYTYRVYGKRDVDPQKANLKKEIKFLLGWGIFPRFIFGLHRQSAARSFALHEALRRLPRQGLLHAPSPGAGSTYKACLPALTRVRVKREVKNGKNVNA